MENPCSRPHKLPRRRRFRVLTGFVEMYGTGTKLLFTEVMANNPDDALMQFDRVSTWYGETIVEEIT